MLDGFHRFSGTAVSFLLALTFLLGPSAAYALPQPGAHLADAVVNDVEGRTLHIGSLLGRAVLILYEDKASVHQNQALKEELSALAASMDARRVAFVPVADLTAYDYWPARGFARRALRNHSRALGIPIYCDWDGAFRRTYRFESGLSNVVLAAPDGTVQFASYGPLDAAARARLLSALHTEAGS